MVLVAKDDADQIVVVSGVDEENPGVANAGKHLWSDRQTCPAVHLGGGRGPFRRHGLQDFVPFRPQFLSMKTWDFENQSLLYP